MKFESGEIKAYRCNQDGLDLIVHFKGNEIMNYIKDKQVKTFEMKLDDGRLIRAEQRKKAYATIWDLSVHTGYLPEELKEWLKYLHISRTGSDYFSLSNCSVDTAREYINTIMEYALEHGVILTDFGLNRTDDTGTYLYACIKHKKCAICGKIGELHHWDAIGMGKDRRHFDDSPNRKICLCRTHHTECHTIGRMAFEQKYKAYGIRYDLDGCNTQETS